MQYVLDVEKWICGGGIHGADVYAGNCIGDGVTRMLNSEGYMCCLGQFAKQVGVSDSALISGASPSTVDGTMKAAGGLGSRHVPYDLTFVDKIGNNTDLSNALMSINDSRMTKLATKITYIRRELKKTGHSLKVLNGHLAK